MDIQSNIVFESIQSSKLMLEEIWDEKMQRIGLMVNYRIGGEMDAKFLIHS
jgi:hypothetical protein